MAQGYLEAGVSIGETLAEARRQAGHHRVEHAVDVHPQLQDRRDSGPCDADDDDALRAGQLTGGGRVSVVVSDAQDAGVVALADAPPPGPDRAYQLWVLDGITPVSVGLLPAGVSRATELIRGVRGRGGFAVSLEPASGSPKPTTTPLVAVPFV